MAHVGSDSGRECVHLISPPNLHSPDGVSADFQEKQVLEILRTKSEDMRASFKKIVAIIGVQNAGKSTTINHMFGTDFPCQSLDGGAGKTTQGCLISKKGKKDELVILDFEGTGNREGTAEFDLKMALFAFSVSDVILNIFTRPDGYSIGRHFEEDMAAIFQVLISMGKVKEQTRTMICVVNRMKRTNPDDSQAMQRQAQVYRETVGLIDDSIRKAWAAACAGIPLCLEDYLRIEMGRLPEEEDAVHPSTEFKQNLEDVLALVRNAESRANDMDDAELTRMLQSTWAYIRDNKLCHAPTKLEALAKQQVEYLVQKALKSFDTAFQELSQSQQSSRLFAPGLWRGIGYSIERLLDDLNRERLHERVHKDAQGKVVNTIALKIEGTLSAQCGLLTNSLRQKYLSRVDVSELIGESDTERRRVLLDFQESIDSMADNNLPEEIRGLIIEKSSNARYVFEGSLESERNTHRNHKVKELCETHCRSLVEQLIAGLETFAHINRGDSMPVPTFWEEAHDLYDREARNTRTRLEPLLRELAEPDEKIGTRLQDLQSTAKTSINAWWMTKLRRPALQIATHVVDSKFPDQPVRWDVDIDKVAGIARTFAYTALAISSQFGLDHSKEVRKEYLDSWLQLASAESDLHRDYFMRCKWRNRPGLSSLDFITDSHQKKHIAAVYSEVCLRLNDRYDTLARGQQASLYSFQKVIKNMLYGISLEGGKRSTRLKAVFEPYRQNTAWWGWYYEPGDWLPLRARPER